MRNFLIAILFCLFSFGVANAAPIWNVSSVSGNVTNDLKIELNNEFRYEDSLGYQANEIGFMHNTTDWAKFGVSYKYVSRPADVWTFESRPNVNVLLNYSYFEDLNKFELSMIGDEDKAYRYRNKLIVKYPGDYKWTPFISNELFININSEETKKGDK